MELDLTNAERLMLINQYKILAKLNEGTSDEDYYNKRVEILERGYEWYYSNFIHSAPLRKEVSDETMDILNMFRQLGAYVEQLTEPERETLDVKKLSFRGFDGNNDPHFGFTKFIIEKDDKYPEYKGTYLNSHTSSTLPQYRGMLAVYKERRGSNFKNLTLEDLKAISDAESVWV